MEIGGYNDVPDGPRMGPSLLIATCLIVAVRTARWPATHDPAMSNVELEKEIEYASRISQRVLSVLIKLSPSMFPSKNRLGTQQRGTIIRSDGDALRKN